MTDNHRVITEEEMEAVSADAGHLQPLTTYELAAYLAVFDVYPGGVVYIGPEEEWT